MFEPNDAPLAKAARRTGFNWRLWGFTALFEGALIVASVLLGLALTGWAQDAAEKQRVNEMRGYILREIASNRAIILDDQHLAHHKRLKEIVGKVAYTGVTLEEANPAFGALLKTGVHLPPVDDSVWRSISSADLLRHMPPDEVFAMARVYRTHDDLELIQQSVYNSLTQLPASLMRGEAPAGAAVQITLSLSDLVAVEERLIDRYDAVLEPGKVKAEAPKAAPTPAAPPT